MDDQKDICNSGDSLEHIALVEVSVESWRFARTFSRFLSKCDAEDSLRYVNQIRYFLKKIETNLEKVGLSVVSLEGQRYDVGMAITTLNISDFDPEDVLVVDQMVEPIVMGPLGLVRSGTALLAKVK